MATDHNVPRSPFLKHRRPGTEPDGMGVQVLLATAAAVACVYAALFHGWVFVQHRASRDHLWVAVTAAGAATVCLGTVEMYLGRSSADALRAQQLQALAAPALTCGLLHFSVCRFHISAPRLIRSADVFFAGLGVLCLLAPQLLFDPTRPPKQIVGFGFVFLQLEFTPLAVLLLAVAMGYFVTPVVFCVQAHRRGERGASSLLIALGIYLVAGVNDSAVGLGIWNSPYLMPTGGYLALVLGISSILMRDFVLAMDEAERLGAQLQVLARARTDALRAVELQLARGEQLAAIGTLAAGVAHEINNPLAYVSANLNQLEAFWRSEPDPAEVEEILADCREGLARVRAIASDLLRMARDGAGEQEEFDLSGVVRSVVPLLEREAGPAIRLSAELEVPLPVRGSARLVGQVALNLVLNAIHALGARSNAHEPCIEVRTRAARDGAELVVRDNGPGIPPEVLGRVFEPSFTTKPIGVGSGLGLALVRLIVTRHRGEIQAESGLHGTVVTVWLPNARAAERPAAYSRPAAPPIPSAMERALLLATVVVPLYTGALHGWIYLQRRREAMHLWLAVAAFAASAIAVALLGHGHSATFAEARSWQQLQITAGGVLAIGFVRWALAFLELDRPRVEAALWLLCGLVAAGLAGGAIFTPSGVVRQVVLDGPPVPEPGLTTFGQSVLAFFVFFVGYVGVELALAWRRKPDARPVFLAYAAFAATLFHDAARGPRWIAGPELLPFGYLAMVTGISAVAIRGFVRSMEQAERLASHLHERVEERSAELHRKEVLLIQGERLATLGTLAAGVAHEINDPMAFVSSNLNRVEEIWGDARERADVPEILAECRDGLGRLRATVSELLRLARGSDAERVPVDLAEVVRSVLPVVRTEARYRAQLVEDLAPVPAVPGNPGLLAQVALQLLLNGIRSIPEEPRDHEVRVSTRFADGRVRLCVRDDGPAIPAERLPTLFDPFSAASAEAGGARLGLAVTHQIVSQHGGDIAVLSTAAGTEVTVSLPTEPVGPATKAS